MCDWILVHVNDKPYVIQKNKVLYCRETLRKYGEKGRCLIHLGEANYIEVDETLQEVIQMLGIKWEIKDE